MEMFETRSGPVIIIEARGRIDSTTATTFGARLTELIEAGCPRLVVDLSDIVYISSAGFRALLVAGRRADEVDGRLVLCGVAGEVRRLFELGAFIDLFAICASREEGVAHAS